MSYNEERVQDVRFQIIRERAPRHWLYRFVGPRHTHNAHDIYAAKINIGIPRGTPMAMAFGAPGLFDSGLRLLRKKYSGLLRYQVSALCAG